MYLSQKETRPLSQAVPSRAGRSRLYRTPVIRCPSVSVASRVAVTCAQNSDGGKCVREAAFMLRILIRYKYEHGLTVKVLIL
jgi:hypothetical protein